MDLKLKNHVVLVTGAAGGIGSAIAAAFVAEGCRVASWDSSTEICSTANGLGLQVNITDFNAVCLALRDTEQALGPVDHLVHAAAIGSGKFGFPFTNLTPADWPKVLEVNIMGTTHIAHAVAPGMIERRRGTMVFLASVAGQIGSPTDPPYSASKAANINFAQCMARDLAPHGVRVNTVCPGMIQTALNRSVWQAWHDQQPPEQRKSYEAWAGEKIKAVIPLGQWQRPEDIANMVVFLSSERTAQVTGQTINVDGGFVMHC